jgi:hypothetical protein
VRRVTCARARRCSLRRRSAALAPLLHFSCGFVLFCAVAPERSIRLNVTLDAQYAEKLSRLAERTHTQEGTLARSLLSHALDEADPDPRHAADLLDGIPGAYERALLGREQAKAGTTIPLDDL